MNILFVTRSLMTGGVSIVSVILANNLAKRGYNVSLFILSQNLGEQRKKVDEKVDVFYGDGIEYNRKNVELLRGILKNKSIDIVINQWGLHWMNIKLIRKAQGNKSIKVFSVYHNDPASNGRLQTINIKLEKAKSRKEKIFLDLQKRFVKFVTSKSMRYVYNHSDKYLLLSRSYIDNFKDFVKISNINKLDVQTNPITIDATFDENELSGKEKTIIYIGRLDSIQKRVSRILQAWSLLEKDNKDWKLKIVGDGEEKKHLEELIRDYDLDNVSLEGFRNPVEYYRKASILVLASEFEGFPLVLPESMSFGVVPVVYASYPAVYDIIEDKIDGLILPYNTQGFDPHDFAFLLQSLMRLSNMDLLQMQKKAIEKSKNYSIDVIIKQWEEKFKQ